MIQNKTKQNNTRLKYKIIDGMTTSKTGCDGGWGRKKMEFLENYLIVFFYKN